MEKENSNNKNNENKKENQDIDDYIFKDEPIKLHSEK